MRSSLKVNRSAEPPQDPERLTPTVDIEDMRKAVSIGQVLKLINYHVDNNADGFKQTAMAIAKDLNDKGFDELAHYIWAMYREVRTFEITD